jgi:hypothetical protein
MNRADPTAPRCANCRTLVGLREVLCPFRCGWRVKVCASCQHLAEKFSAGHVATVSHVRPTPGAEAAAKNREAQIARRVLRARADRPSSRSAPGLAVSKPKEAT